MNKNILWAFVGIVLLAVLAWAVFGMEPTPPATETLDETPAAGSEVPTDGSPAESRMITVTYTDQGFSPTTLSVNVGDTVRFSNQSTGEMWVGADEHPTHTEYDGTSKDDHCAEGAATGGAFDQCGRSGPGSTYNFTFTKAGTFDYHNHARSSDGGTVVVE